MLKMKSKKRHHESSEESEESDAVKSSSTSESDSDDSSISEPRHKKKKKRVDSSDSESNSEQKRAKKRKHKKKKKKHNKKKRRSDSLDDISDDNISISEGEISNKKKRKHKHKHSKRAQNSVTDDERYDNQGERRLHSVVKERRASSEAGSQPSRTYYQKEYHEPAQTDNYGREQQPQKYYRDSSKQQHDYRDNYNYDRERNERYVAPEDKFNRQREKYGQTSHFPPNPEYSGRQREYDDYKRPARYEEQRREDHYKRERDAQYENRDDARGNVKYNRYDEKPLQKRREYDDARDYRERRAPPEPVRYHDKDYEKRDRYHVDRPSLERSRDVRRDRPTRPEKPPLQSQYKPRSRSRSEENRSFRDKRADEREDKGRDRYKEEREERVRERYKEDREERRDRPRRSAERDRRPTDTRRPDKSDPSKSRERKSRFDNGNDNKDYSWGKTDVKKEGEKTQGEKEKPNFGLSGKLTADANTVNGVVIKYTEPDDAKQPKRRWRFYPFKGDKALPILYIHRQSSFLIGRDKKIVDIALEHPSISKQHAALQYRATPFTRADGSQGRRVRPYIIDLESANGTFVNNKQIEPRRYTELLERDVVKFGFSQREYVLLHENSKDDAQDDDQEPICPVTTTDQIKQEKRAKEAAVADGE